MILVIDNYDSFSYNLVQMAGSINPQIKVIRNDEMTVKEIVALTPSHMIISPGPGYPQDAGVCEDVIRALATKIPILGVCLGHQAICECYGANICRATHLMHGKKSSIRIDNTCPIFYGLPQQIDAGRYHSLVACKDTIPPQLEVTATDNMGTVMAIKHKEHHVYGLQFHPESILTPMGSMIIKNFLKIGRQIQ